MPSSPPGGTGSGHHKTDFGSEVMGGRRTLPAGACVVEGDEP